MKAFAIDDVRAALDTDDKRVRDERLLPVYDKVHAEFDEKFPEEADKIDDCCISSKNSLYVAGCWMTASVWMGAALMRSARWQQRLMCSSARTVPPMFTRGQTQVLTVTTLGPGGRRPNS